MDEQALSGVQKCVEELQDKIDDLGLEDAEQTEVDQAVQRLRESVTALQGDGAAELSAGAEAGADAAAGEDAG